ncbi:MAG: hypothetical protein VX367_13590 [SAR324 cluster bacterium]|nr:hypothetical protein [SAR324 cluster bacterium]
MAVYPALFHYLCQALNQVEYHALLTFVLSFFSFSVPGGGASSGSSAVRIHYIQTTEVAGLSHDKLHGIHVLLLLKRILQLASK